MSDELPVCPECDTASLGMSTASKSQADEDNPRYRCKKCYAQFNNPNYRDRENPSGSVTPGGLSPAAKTLWDADPDDIDLQADGGTTCPDCGGVLEHRSGCETCIKCGYSECGGHHPNHGDRT